MSVIQEANELIMMGRSISNAGYFMKRVDRECREAQKYVDKHNMKLFKQRDEQKSIIELETELERLTKLLKSKQSEV